MSFDAFIITFYFRQQFGIASIRLTPESGMKITVKLKLILMTASYAT